MTLLDMFHLMNPCSLGYEIRKVQIFPKITKTVIAKPFSLILSLQIFPSLPSLHVFILDGSRSSCFIQCTTVKLSHLRGPKSQIETAPRTLHNEDCTQTVPYHTVSLAPKWRPNFSCRNSLYIRLWPRL